MDRIPDAPLFARSRRLRGYALNKLAMTLSALKAGQPFWPMNPPTLDRFSLTPAQSTAVLPRDWAWMVSLGGNLFYILKISAVDPWPSRAICAAQAWQSLDEFLNKALRETTFGNRSLTAISRLRIGLRRSSPTSRL